MGSVMIPTGTQASGFDESMRSLVAASFDRIDNRTMEQSVSGANNGGCAYGAIWRANHAIIGTSVLRSGDSRSRLLYDRNTFIASSSLHKRGLRESQLF